MKITSKTCTLRGCNAVRFIAVIGKSKKLGIAKRHQKTWSFPTVAPQFTLTEITPTVEAEARRWEKKILERASKVQPQTTENRAGLSSPI